MWLSEKTGGMKQAEQSHAKVGTVSVGGGNASVIVSGECRNLNVVGPQGMLWRPGKGQQALVLQTDDGERFILGVVGGENSAVGDGEVCLRCGETWLKIGKNGDISAEGELHLAGDVYITGRLFLNGNEILPEGGD